MKKISLKWKLTLLYTLLMTLLTGLVLAVLLHLGSGRILASSVEFLKERVLDSGRLVEAGDGALSVDSDFFDVENGVYLSLYDENGTLLAGRTPYGFGSAAAYQENTVQTVKRRGVTWYLYDASFSVRGYGTVRARGICSVSAVEEELRLLTRLAFILLPMIVALSAILCYSLVKRTLRPVSLITRTAGEICEKKDLTRRIGLTGGKKDEIATLARTFDAMLDQLQVSFEQQKQFTSDVSHELRTPLAVILAQCDSLLKEEGLAEEDKASVQVIRDRAQGLTRLVSQLLFLSRADQDRQVLAFETLDFSLLTRTVLEEQAEGAKQKEIALTWEVPDGVTLEGDETLLFRLWLNLLDNAVAYTEPGGQIRAGIFSDGQQVTGYVKDTGAGISPEALPHIWERFYRADGSRTDSSHSGLGLSMVKWIVKAHNGSIRAESSLGEGSAFTFTLPIKRK